MVVVDKLVIIRLDDTSGEQSPRSQEVKKLIAAFSARCGNGWGDGNGGGRDRKVHGAPGPNSWRGIYGIYWLVIAAKVNRISRKQQTASTGVVVLPVAGGRCVPIYSSRMQISLADLAFSASSACSGRGG